MSMQERRHMRAVDEAILAATGEELRRLQELDSATQLDGRSFYDTYAESRRLAPEAKKPGHS